MMDNIFEQVEALRKKQEEDMQRALMRPLQEALIRSVCESTKFILDRRENWKKVKNRES